MFTKYEVYAKCAKCGALYDGKKTCLNCAVAYMRVWQAFADTVDRYNYEWKHTVVM